MNLFSDGGVYVLLLLFGAVAVAIHSAKLFATPLPQSAQTWPSPLLLNVDLRYMSGAWNRKAGFLCYLGINEFIYLILSSSSAILDLSLSVIGGEGSVGAATMAGAEFNPMTPILASSVMLTIGQIKPFSQVENAVRQLSHHVAGIPHGVDEMRTRLATFRFDSTCTQEHDVAVGHAIEFATRARRFAEPHLSVPELDALVQNIVRIYALRAWTYGADGERMWSAQNLAAVKSLVDLIEPRYSLLDVKLQMTIRDEQQADSIIEERQESWRSILTESSVLKNDFMALFSLLMINQPEARVPANAGQIVRLVSRLTESHKQEEMNALIGSTLFGTFAGIAAICVFYMGVMVAPVTGGSGFSATDATGFNGVFSTLVPILNKSIAFSLEDMFGYALVFLVSAAVALTVRSSRIVNMQWIYWSGRRNPFRQYLSVSVVAAAIALLFYVLYMFSTMVVVPSLALANGELSISLLKDFRSRVPEFIAFPSIGIVCAWAVCMLSDTASSRLPNSVAYQQNDRSGSQTSGLLWSLRFALMCAGLNLVIRLSNGNIGDFSDFLGATFIPLLAFFPYFAFYSLFHSRSERLAETAISGNTDSTPPASKVTTVVARPASATSNELSQ